MQNISVPDEAAKLRAQFKRMGLKRNALANYFSSRAKNEPIFANYGESQLSLILNGHKPEHVAGLRERLEQVFEGFDWDDPKAPIDEDVREVLARIKNLPPAKLKRGSDGKSMVITYKVSKQVAISFQGLYLGATVKWLDREILPAYYDSQGRKLDVPKLIADKKVEISPYLFKISGDGDVEIKTKGTYFRAGFLTSYGNHVYFILDSAKGREPEFYVTSIPVDLEAEVFTTAEFTMCGAWLDRRKRPTYGSSKLFRQLEPDSILPTFPKGSLHKVVDEVFEELQRLASYDDLCQKWLSLPKIEVFSLDVELIPRK